MIDLFTSYKQMSILDVGCGFADLYPYLKTHHDPFTYTGLDHWDRAISICKKRFPELSFIHDDLRSYSPKTDFDVCIGSGILSQLDGYDPCFRMIDTLFSWSSFGTVFNLLSLHATNKDPQFYYYDPAKILSYCLTLTPYVSVHHHYLENDFTIWMYR